MSPTGGRNRLEQSSQSSLGSAIRDLRDEVEKKLRDYSIDADGHAAPPDQLDSLHRALEELNASWENLNAQSEHVAQEREHYAQLFRLAPDAYVVTDAYGIISEANDAAQKLLRLSTSYLAGKALQLFITTEHRAAFRSNLNDLVSQGVATAKTWSGALRRSESAMTVEFTVGAIRTPDASLRLCWVLRPKSG